MPKPSAPRAVSRGRSPASRSSRWRSSISAPSSRARFSYRKPALTIRPPSSIFSRVSFLRASDVVVRFIRSSLASAARSRARCVRRGRCRTAASLTDFLPSACSSLTSAKPLRQFFECRLKLHLVDLDLAKTGLERNAADTFGLACLGVLQLLLELGDLFADFGGRLFHLRLVLSCRSRSLTA
nr:hypothetical protein SHINE37_90117 [Rhizobiaceae bacterium]